MEPPYVRRGDLNIPHRTRRYFTMGRSKSFRRGCNKTHIDSEYRRSVYVNEFCMKKRTKIHEITRVNSCINTIFDYEGVCSRYHGTGDTGVNLTTERSCGMINQVGWGWG